MPKHNSARLHLNITEDELERLVDLACRRGYLRDDPRKAWSSAERRDAARYALYKLIEKEHLL